LLTDYDLPHRPSSKTISGCTQNLKPRVSSSLYTVEELETALEQGFDLGSEAVENLVEFATYDPVTDVRAFNPLFYWYARLTEDLENGDALITSLDHFLRTELPMSHPSYAYLREAVTAANKGHPTLLSNAIRHLRPAFKPAAYAIRLGSVEIGRLDEVFEREFPVLHGLRVHGTSTQGQQQG
ncbi:hypothetical protein JCM11641_006611, partial [Rhodosporidiobolus odoratus]